jgi:hypothetical protein
LLSGIPTSKEVASKIRYFYREYSSFNWTKNEIPPNSPSYFDVTLILELAQKFKMEDNSVNKFFKEMSIANKN